MGACLVRAGWAGRDTPEETLSPQPGRLRCESRSLQSLNSLLSLLGDRGAGSLDSASGVAEELGVDALQGDVSLSLGLLDAVSVRLPGLVVRRVVL